MIEPLIDLLETNLPAVQSRMRELGWIGADETIVDAGSAGEGNMNRTLRANLGNRSLVLKQSVPFVAKYPDIPAPVERVAIEAAFYDAVRGTPAVAGRMPELVGYDAEQRLLCFEDLGPAQDFTFLYQGGEHTDETRNTLAILATWLSELHALGVESAFTNRAMRQLNHEHIFLIPLMADNGVAIAPELADLYDSFAADGDLRTRAENLGAVYLGTAGHASRPVLLHGDFYPGSWLMDPARGPMVIDPEFGFDGPAEFDIGVFTAHLTMCGFPPAEVEAILENYAPPEGFDTALASAFAGMEVIRRIFGVAQLPLSADVTTQHAWLENARAMVG